MKIKIANLLDLFEHLEAEGYEPDEGSNYADLIMSGMGSLRVDWSDDGRINVYRFDKYEATLWEARLDSCMPAGVVLAMLRAAEDELYAAAGKVPRGEQPDHYNQAAHRQTGSPA